MLSLGHVHKALEAKGSAFEDHLRLAREQLDTYRAVLAWYQQQSREDLDLLLKPHLRPGARPTLERIAGRSCALPFELQWENHQQARAWARQVLDGVPTLAVDGSQITPDPAFSLRVGAVQVGWFENRHLPGGEYVKDLHFEVLSPDELAGGDDEDERGYPDLYVNARRFELECEVIAEYMRSQADVEPAPVCFFDGSLVLSFAARLRPTLQQRYLRAVLDLLAASRETHVPLVGYVDTSRATDLGASLQRLRRIEARPISDAALFGRMEWGQRTELFHCAREDRLFPGEHQQPDYYGSVLFCYLKTAADRPPARLELPSWLLEKGRIEHVIDVVRAECIVGTGYPYAVETADALAVITAQDRERFYRVFQEFLEARGIDLGYSRKAFSKRGRR